jgi:hypothetical protein
MRHRAACSETYARLYNTVHWLGGKKTCLQTAFEKKTPSPAGRTMDIPGTREGRLDGTAPQPSRDRRERPRIQFVRFGLPGTAGAILSRLLRHAHDPLCGTSFSLSFPRLSEDFLTTVFPLWDKL